MMSKLIIAAAVGRVLSSSPKIVNGCFRSTRRPRLLDDAEARDMAFFMFVWSILDCHNSIESVFEHA